MKLSSNVVSVFTSVLSEFGFIEHMATSDPIARLEYTSANVNFTPMTVNLGGDHLPVYNEWSQFFVLQQNKPFMVKTDGTADYELDSNDYTKKVDGTASDVTNSSYVGGAFAWFPKVYTYQYIDGDDRYVYYSSTKKDDNYVATGFFGSNGQELEGVWIPLFYGTEVTQSGTAKLTSLAFGKPTHDRSVPTQKTYIDNLSPNARFFGGPIVNIISDMLMMLGKNADIQAVFGTGNCSAGDGASYMKDNACISGGAFYGTSTNRNLNKVFHSLVPITQNQSQRDPYTISVGGTIKFSSNYSYDISGNTYQSVGFSHGNISSWVYPNKHIVVDGFGAVPVSPYNGSTTTGDCDAFAISGSGTKVAMRYCSCDAGKIGGPKCLDLRHDASITYWTTGASVMILPPVGYKPF